MDQKHQSESGAGAEATMAAACEILAPKVQTLPIVFASPHSGSHYPDAFVKAARLGPVRLRRSEDAFVDQLYLAAPELGAPLLRALFPRAYVDPNREKFELDPAMFDGPLPPHANSRSIRVGAGLGTVARVITSGDEIYDAPLEFSEVAKRIEAHYVPYHEALKGLIAQTRKLFGYCILIDCHSMPSIGGPMDRDPGDARVEFVLGDNHGIACDERVTDRVETYLKSHGKLVRRNSPYAGGYTTVHYGQPDANVHVLQIEINRAIYMDEDTITKNAGFEQLAALLRGLIKDLGALPDLSQTDGGRAVNTTRPPVEIRACEPSDLEAICEIYGDFVENSLSTFEEVVPDLAVIRTRWAERQAKNLPYLVAVDAGRVIGFAYASAYRKRSGYRYLVEDSIYVSPQASGRGVGRALLGALIDRCTEIGFRQMIAVVTNSENAASVGLHAAFGFSIIGELPAAGYKFGRWLDTTLMQRALGDGAKTNP